MNKISKSFYGRLVVFDCSVCISIDSDLIFLKDVSSFYSLNQSLGAVVFTLDLLPSQVDLLNLFFNEGSIYYCFGSDYYCIDSLGGVLSFFFYGDHSDNFQKLLENYDRLKACYLDSQVNPF